MSFILPVIIIILSMLISFCMQLVPGTFALFYHYTLGKSNAKKADDQSLSFIIGAEIFIATIWIFIYFLTFVFFYNFPNLYNIFLYIMAGIFFAEALAALFLYYRKGKTTALFIPRRLAKGIVYRIKKIKNRSDCILTGALIELFELAFTLPLYLISTSVISNFNILPCALITAAYLIISILPLFITHYAFKHGNNLADIERFRVKIKPTIKLVLFFSFLFLAVTTIYLGVINNG